MNLKDRIKNHYKGKSPLRISTDILFYAFILAVILPFSRKHVMTGMNRAIMLRPAIIADAKQYQLTEGDYDWALQDMEGKIVSFSDFRGEAVFLSFWATWCPPCRAELPNIQNLHDEFGNRISMILASNEDAALLKKFLSDNDYDFPVYRMVENPPTVFQAGSIPTTFLVTPDGNISVKKTGAARWDGKFFQNYLEGILVD